jgi:hypothetical protein
MRKVICVPMPIKYSQILPALPVFESVVRHGSFSPSADKLGLTQSTILRRIKQWEGFGCISYFTTGTQIAGHSEWSTSG